MTGIAFLEVFVAGPISAGVGLARVEDAAVADSRFRRVARSLNKVSATHAVWFNERCIRRRNRRTLSACF
jgi:hypothetical protein